MSMLNCRNYNRNYFTCKDVSVVDYAIIPYEQLYLYKQFKVIHMHDLFELAGCVGKYDPVRHLPGHNLLFWNMDLSSFINVCEDTRVNPSNIPPASFAIYDLSQVTDNFLIEQNIEHILNTINAIESDVNTRQQINHVYDQFSELLKQEMDNKLSHKIVIIKDGLSHKRRKIKKSYWNTELDELYKDFREADRQWSRARGTKKERLKAIKCAKQKTLDKAVQKDKRSYWQRTQEEILALQQENSKEFWKYVGNIGMGSERHSKVPWQVIMTDSSISKDKRVVLDQLDTKYSELLNGPSDPITDTSANIRDNEPHAGPPTDLIDTRMPQPITLQEVKLALTRTVHHKALTVFQWMCFAIQVQWNFFSIYTINVLIVPDIWQKGIITPIPKDSTKDQQVPLNYCGITLASSVYKIYCSILNQRLNQWAEANGLVEDEQNGFRKSCSCQDHLSSLANIIDNRKLVGKSTYVGFIDFSKAYDRIKRHKLWSHLNRIGVPDKFLSALKSL